MGTKIEFKALYGSSSSGPVSSLLCINDFKLLLDCGWDDRYDIGLLKPIEEVTIVLHDQSEAPGLNSLELGQISGICRWLKISMRC